MFIRSHKKASLRFRQWRRKSYAVFNSVGRHVTIGSIKGVVADTLLRKQKVERAFAYELIQDTSIPDETDDPPGQSPLTTLLPLLSCKLTLGEPQERLYSYSFKWLKVSYSLSAIFIFNQPQIHLT